MRIVTMVLATSLAAGTLVSRTASAAIAGEGVAGYFSTDDNFNHAVIAQSNGNVDECWWQDGGGVGCATLVNVAPVQIVSISGFYSSYDRARHAVVAGSNGQIWDYNYVPGGGSALDLIGTLSTSLFGHITTSASYATPDRFQHYVMGTNTGRVMQFRWSPYVGGGGLESVGTSFTSLSNVSGFYQGTTEYISARGSRGQAGYDLYVAGFNGDTSTSTAYAAYYDDIGFDGTTIGVKFVNDGGHPSDVMFAFTGGYMGYGYYYSPFSAYFAGTEDHSGLALQSFGAYYESGQSTYHGIVGTTGGGIYDLRIKNNAISSTFLNTYN